MDAERSVKFRLNPKFYSKTAILQTIEDYKEVCSADFDDLSSQVTLKPKEPCDLKELSLEFCNYCLGMMK